MELIIKGGTVVKEISLVEEKNEDESISNDELFNISSWGADLSFREIIMMYDEGELLKPELQRNYVWTKLEASRFIDSILQSGSNTKKTTLRLVETLRNMSSHPMRTKTPSKRRCK